MPPRPRATAPQLPFDQKLRQINWWDKLKTEEHFAAAHVLPQKDEPETYIGKMFDLILGNTGKPLVK